MSGGLSIWSSALGGEVRLDPELLDLPQGHLSRRSGHQVDAAGGLRERDHVADRGTAGQEGDDSIDSQGDAAVRRRAQAQGRKQEAELRLGLLVADAEDPENLRLHVTPV